MGGPALAQTCEPGWRSPVDSPNGAVHSIIVWDEPGAIPTGVYIGGEFTGIGPLRTEHVARWDGAAWREVTPLPELRVRALTVARVEGVLELLAGGIATGAASVPDELVWIWDDRGDWKALDNFSAFGGVINAFAPFSIQRDDELVAGGRVNDSQSHTLFSYDRGWIDRLDGSGEVFALTTWTDSNGMEYLLVGGRSVHSGIEGVGLLRVDSEGDTTVMGNMVNWTVTAMATPNPRIVYAARNDGEQFEVVRWNGQAWEPIAAQNAFDGPIHAMAFMDPDGPGPMGVSLIVGGAFSMTGGTPAANLAVWDGSAWSEFGGGTDGDVLALKPIGAERLFVGGTFHMAGGVSSPYVARRDTCFCYADCDEASGAGVLDIFDFLCFQNAFVNGDAFADCDGSQTLDILDFLCFQDSFVMGCP